MLSFADSYNTTRRLTVALDSTLDSLLPPPVFVEKTTEDSYVVFASFDDIRSRFYRLVELVTNDQLSNGP
jgi:hypothetical protein